VQLEEIQSKHRWPRIIQGSRGEAEGVNAEVLEFNVSKFNAQGPKGVETLKLEP
jgi:hypothetical protein